MTLRVEHFLDSYLTNLGKVRLDPHSLFLLLGMANKYEKES